MTNYYKSSVISNIQNGGRQFPQKFKMYHYYKQNKKLTTVRRPFSPNTQYTAIYFQYMRPKNDNLKMLTKQNKGDPRQEIFSPSLDLVQYFGKILNKSKFNQQTVLASIGGINYVAGKTKLWQIPPTDIKACNSANFWATKMV